MTAPDSIRPPAIIVAVEELVRGFHNIVLTLNGSWVEPLVNPLNYKDWYNHTTMSYHYFATLSGTFAAIQN